MAPESLDEIRAGPVRLYQAAPSRLTTYLDCARRYRYQYLDRPMPAKGPPWGHNSVGASIHNALAGWWRLPLAERTVDRAGDLVDEGWLTDGFRDQEHCDEACGTARRMVERYVCGLDPAVEPIGVERTVATTTAHAALFGRVDRIDDRDAEGIVVVDYKTGRHVLTVDDARTSLALAVYAAAAARVFKRPVRRVELHHLPSGEVVGWEHTDEGLARHLGRADAIAQELAGLDARFRSLINSDGDADAAGSRDRDERASEADRLFPASVGPICGWCDFNQVCEEGGRAVRPVASWAGVPTS